MAPRMVRDALARVAFAIFCFSFLVDAAVAQSITPPNPSTCQASPPPLEAGSTPTYPGRWWNPERFGTGWDFLYSPLLDAEGKFAIYWFTFDKNGTPTWLIGTMRRVALQPDGHLRSVGFLYAPHFEYGMLAPDGKPYNAVTRYDKVGEVGITFPTGTSTRAAISWTWTNNGSTYSGQECIYDAFRDQPPPEGESFGLNQAFTANWFDPTRAGRGIGSWGFDLVIGRTPADGLWHEIVTAQIFDENSKPVWLQYARSHSGEPPLDNTATPGQLVYTRSRYPGGVPTTTCTATQQGPNLDGGCVKHVEVGVNSASNYFKHVFTGANAGKIELKVNVSGGAIDNDPAVSWPPLDMDLTVPPVPRPYADPGANVPVSRTTEVDRIIADRTLCVVNNPGDTCRVVISYTTTKTWVYIEKLNLDTNVATTIPRQGQFATIDEDLPVGSRFKYALRSNDGSNITYSQTAEVRVVGKMAVPDQVPVSLADDLPQHDAGVGTLAGSASTDGGSARYQISIQAPPGRAGMAPAVSLNYSSNGGNGLGGMGMSLSASSSIARCARTMAQDGTPRAVAYDANDALCLDGQRLVLEAGTYGQTNAEYRTEIDTYARIKQYGSLAGDACFTVEAKGGRVSNYGTLVSGQSCADATEKGRVARLFDPGLADTWLIVKTADRVGNAMSYWYSNSDSGGSIPKRETLLDAIRYTDSAATAGDRWIRFEYQNRPTGSGANDYGVWTVGGGLSVRTKRLTRIYTQVGTKTVRDYRLSYQDAVTGLTYSNYSGRSLLREVQECAYAQGSPFAPTCVTLPTRFAWSDASPDPNAPNAFARKDKLRNVPLSGMPVAVAPAIESGAVETAQVVALNATGDLNGDGSREAWLKVRTGTTPPPINAPIYEYRLVPTTPDRTFGIPIVMTGEEVNQVPGNDDFDGDGLGDGIALRPGDANFQLVRWSQPRGTWPTSTGASFDTYFEHVPLTIPTTDNMQRVETADFDGDGRPDLLFKRHNATCTNSATQSAWNELVVYLNRIAQTTGERGRFVEGPARCLGSTFANARVDGEQVARVADFDADGRADILLSDSRTPTRAIAVLARIRTPASGSGIEFFDESATTIGLGDVAVSLGLTSRWMDVNGDGSDDFVYANRNDPTSKWIVRLNLANARFTPPIETTTVGNVGLDKTLGNFKYAAFLPAADVDGDGRAEFLRPARVAAAFCPIMRRKTCGDPGDCDVNACPDDPATGQRVVPPGETLGDDREVQSLYTQWGGASFDPSAYYMNAVRFVVGPLGTDGLPTISAVDTPTGIVSTLRGADGVDLYGDGLSDVASLLGCFNCIEATDKLNPNNPARPAYLPDSAATNISTLVNNAQLFVNENTGAGERTGGLAHRLPELLSVVTNGLGDQASWDYSPLSSRAGRGAGETPLYALPTAANSYVDADHIYFTSSMPVVASMWQSNGLVDVPAPGDMLGARSFVYNYAEAMFNTKGRGFQGFRTIANTNDVSGADAARRVRTTVKFLQKFPFSGLIESSTVEIATSASNMTLAARTENNWFNLAPGGSNSQQPLLNYSVSRAYDTSNGTCAGQEVSNVSTFNRTIAAPTGKSAWDSFGNLFRQHVIKRDSGCDAVVSNHTTVMNATYDLSSPNLSAWWVDRLTQRKVETSISYAPAFAIPLAQPVTSQTLTTNYVWNDGTRTLASQEATADGLQAITRYRYDTGWYGLPYEVEAVGTAAGGARTSKLTYTPDFYFLAAQENPFGHVIEMQTRPSDGSLTRVKDATGLVTRTDYDVFGRAIQVTKLLADDVTVVEPPARSAWTRCVGGSCVAPSGESAAGQQRAAFRVTTVQDGSPTSASWYDALGRVIKTAERGFDPRTTTFSLQDSTWVQALVEYDAFGQVARRSTPHCLTSTTLCGQSAVLWSTYRYDAAGRMIAKTEVAPFANLTRRDLETTYGYFGNRTEIRVGPPNAGAGCSNCLSMKRYASVLGSIAKTEDALGGVTRYWHDAAGNSIALADANGSVIGATYNAFGHRLTSSDPNRGNWSFVYDAFGELYEQTDARGLKTYTTYDPLGRVVERRSTQTVAQGAVADETVVDSWIYADSPGTPDTHLRGLLKEVKRNVKTGAAPFGVDTWSESYGYDTAKRIDKIKNRIVVNDGAGAENFETALEYDQTYNRLKVLNYPSGLRVQTRYTAYGQVHEIRDADLMQSYSRIDVMGPWGNVIQKMYGNNTLGAFAPNPGTGQDGTRRWFLGGINGVQQDSVGYTYDVFGNLGTQTRAFYEESGTMRSYAENYTYDSLHRLTKAQFQEMTAGQVGPVNAVNYGYDPVGNLRWKDDYSAPGSVAPYPYQYGSLKPNAVTSVLKAGTTSQYRTYAYDPNGNLVGDALPTNEISGVYDAQNLPRRLSRGTGSQVKFDYSATGERYRENDNGLVRIKLPFGLERGGNGKWRHELGDAIVERTVRSQYPVDGTNKVWYAYRDRLDSTIAVADGFGQILGINQVAGSESRVNYDAFGKARYINGTVRTTAFNPATGPQGMLFTHQLPTNRGFTNQQHFDNVQLIHMNGRAYDYQLGRFLSVDPYIQEPRNSQSPNAYSYIMNNPLSGLDPSGYWARSPDNSRQCFGIDACQETRDLEFIRGSAGDLRASVSYGGATSNGSDIWGEARSRVGQTAENRLWTALIVGVITMRDIVEHGSASSGTTTMDEIVITENVPRSRAPGTPKGRNGIWNITKVGVGFTLFVMDANQFGEAQRRWQGLPIGCYGACTCEGQSTNFCAASSGDDKSKDLRGASHPMEGMQISTPAPGPGGNDNGDGAGATTYNWKSGKQFGHTFSEHGSKRPLQQLIDRARGGNTPQGQWLDNEKAANLLGRYGKTNGVTDIRIPPGLGRVIMPNGSILEASWARIVPGSNGIRTAFPILPPVP